MTLAEFKALVREQYFMLLIDEEAALAPFPRCSRRMRPGEASADPALRGAGRDAVEDSAGERR